MFIWRIMLAQTHPLQQPYTVNVIKLPYNKTNLSCKQKKNVHFFYIAHFT